MRLSSFISVAVVASALVVGCGPGKFSKSENTGPVGVLRYPIVTKPTTMDPSKVQDGDTIDVLQQIYEGLVGWNEKNEIEPRLAEKWEIVDGGKTYIFTLRKDAKFHNGRAIKADDFKFAIERACNPKFSSATAETYLSDIIGVKKRLKGEVEEVEGVKVIDDLHVKVTIDQPRLYFLSKLTFPCAFLMAKEALTDPLKEMNSIEQMVGTGPFKPEKFIVDQYVYLAANKDYYSGAPLISRIERPVVADATTRMALYKAGKVDLVQLERADVVGVKSDATYKEHLKFYDRASMWYIGFHCNNIEALKNPKVRLAFAMAIDKDKIVNETLDGINKRADSIIPPGCFGYREKVKAIQYDLAGAKKLLAEAGYLDGKGLPPLTMFHRENRPDIKVVAQKVGSDLDKLGVKVTFQELQWGTYLEKHNKHDLPVFHMRWAADYLDAENFLSTLLASYGPENKIEYKNDKFDALCRKADGSQDPEERKKLYAEAEDLVLADAPFIPIYFQRDAELVSPRIGGLRDALFGHLPHTKVTVK